MALPMRMQPLRRFAVRDHLRECTICGWVYLRSELRKTWDNKIVCSKDWYPVHPNDKPKNLTESRVRID